MKIQKHSIYQISVPFETVVTEDAYIFSRYIMLNCFTIEDINHVNLEIEEAYEIKGVKPTETKLLRVVNTTVFNEREINGSLHMMLNGLSKNEVTGTTETVFTITLFSELITKLNNENNLDYIKDYFPDWNIDQFIDEPTIPGKLSELNRMQQEMNDESD